MKIFQLLGEMPLDMRCIEYSLYQLYSWNLREPQNPIVLEEISGPFFWTKWQMTRDDAPAAPASVAPSIQHCNSAWLHPALDSNGQLDCWNGVGPTFLISMVWWFLHIFAVGSGGSLFPENLNKELAICQIDPNRWKPKQLWRLFGYASNCANLNNPIKGDAAMTVAVRSVIVVGFTGIKPDDLLWICDGYTSYFIDWRTKPYYHYYIYIIVPYCHEKNL